MHPYNPKCPTWALATAFFWMIAGAVWGQQAPPTMPAHQGYAAIPWGFLSPEQRATADIHYVSHSEMEFVPEKDLATRVKDLEAALKKIKEKEDAEKKKAAGRMITRAGGRLQFEWANFDQDVVSHAQPYGDIQNGGEFRRARIYVAGEGFHIIDYQVEIDFGGTGTTAGGVLLDNPSLKDVYFTVKELPWLQNVRVGHFKEPLGLEQLTGDNYTTFMERSLGDDPALVPGRNMGVMAFGWTKAEYATWAIGAFVDQTPEAPPLYSNDHTATAVTMRGTYLPWYDECTEGRGLIHTGVGYSYRDAWNDTTRFRARPEAHLAPYVVDTGAISTDNYNLCNAEGALVYGPLSLQAEVFTTWLDRPGVLEDPRFYGYYVFVSYFLTGEHRPYRRSEGRFDRVKPRGNFLGIRPGDGDSQSGRGAWELAYRYSNLDLTDTGAGLGAGYAADHTFGVNWYLTPNARLMWNYVHTDVSQRFTPAGMPLPNVPLDAFLIRMQFDF